MVARSSLSSPSLASRSVQIKDPRDTTLTRTKSRRARSPRDDVSPKFHHNVASLLQICVIMQRRITGEEVVRLYRGRSGNRRLYAGLAADRRSRSTGFID